MAEPFEWPDFRCPRCQTLLFRGYLVGIIVCRSCKKSIQLDIVRRDVHILKALSEALPPRSEAVVT